MEPAITIKSRIKPGQTLGVHGRAAETKLPIVDLTLRVRKPPHAEREVYNPLPLA